MNNYQNIPFGFPNMIFSFPWNFEYNIILNYPENNQVKTQEAYLENEKNNPY